MRKVYADYSATTYVKEEVLKEMLPYYNKNYGNPSSIYEEGIIAKKAIENSRSTIARILNADENEIYFTGSGTESDNTAIKGIMEANKDKGNHIITTKIEHHAVLKTCEALELSGYKVTYLNVNKYGRINLEELKNAITDETVMVSIMAVNNEIGTIQDVEEIGNICSENNVIFHSDCVQAIGNIDIDVKKQKLDSISISAHKFYGPKGVGVLYIKDNIKFNNVITGGDQENSKRAGTENVAGIVGCGRALEITIENMKEYIETITNLRNYLMDNLIKNIPNIKINGGVKNKICNNLNVCIKDVDCNMALILLNNQGISASCGSACNSTSKTKSHVLTAIGLSKEDVFSSIRFSLGEKNTYSDMDYIVYTLKNIVEKIRKEK